MPNDTIHEEVEGWLAADLHQQLNPDERATLQQHLAGCATCRTLHEENKTMHQLLENTLAKERPDLGFEEKMVRRFRDGAVPREKGLIGLLSSLIRLRATQVTALAAVLLALVQIGRMVTGEGELFASRPASLAAFSDVRRDKYGTPERLIAAGSGISTAEEARPQAKTFRGAPASLPNDSAKLDLKPAAPPMTLTEQKQKEEPAVDEVDRDAGRVAANEVPSSPAPSGIADGRKLIRNAQLELQVTSYQTAVERLTSLAAEEHGFVATQNSSKLPNGKLQGTIVIKVAPENLDRFLQKARDLGELKNQTVGTEDVTKNYFDTDARLRNAKRMEERLLEMLQKNTGKVADLLQVEKELGRVREEIEKMQGELKYYDTLVQYATVTISLAEKDLNEAAAFLLRETANLSLYSTDVEKTFAEVKGALQNAKVQIVQSTLDRNNDGQVTARMSLLLEPEESEAIINRIKGLGRVQNFNVQTERVAQDGSGLSKSAKVERDKVQLNLVISRTGEEPAVQQTSLRILTTSVAEKAAQLKADAVKANGELRSSTFSRDPNGQEVANITLRVPMKNYSGLVESFNRLGEVKDLSVQRNDQPGMNTNPENSPAEISLQIYSPGRIVSEDAGFGAIIRRTLGQAVAALAWSVRMIGVALAFLAPWALALGLVTWLVLRFARRRS
jgi:hypothetical protein